MTAQTYDIDAVITWVDGDDPAHLAKLNDYLNKLGFKPKSASATRFKSLDEIYYCVKSILVFAPFIRKIFIVTDQQTPNFKDHSFFSAQELEKIVIIDHLHIFQGHQEHLPTFNSLTIETMIFRIQDLAEHFIYLNDDFILIKDTSHEDFFKNEFPILRGKLSISPQFKLKNTILRAFKKLIGITTNTAKTDSFKLAQSTSAQLVEPSRHYFKIGHTPHPLRKSTLQNYYLANPQIIENNIKFKLRNATQFSAISLANHLELKNSTYAVQKNLNLLYLKPYNIINLKRVLKLGQADPNNIFCCIQSLDRCTNTKQRLVTHWLEKIVTNEYQHP